MHGKYTGPTSKTISQLIMEVSELMKAEKPIPQRNQEAIRLADVAPDLLQVVKEYRESMKEAYGGEPYVERFNKLIDQAEGK